MSSGNRHGGLVAIDGAGVLILGPARSGKSALALCLMAQARREGRSVALVADDQVILSARDGRLVGHAPPTLAGLMEISGVGIVPMAHVASAPVVLAVSLDDDPPRMPENDTLRLDEIAVRHIHLPARQASLSADIVLTVLSAS